MKTCWSCACVNQTVMPHIMLHFWWSRSLISSILSSYLEIAIYIGVVEGEHVGTAFQHFSFFSQKFWRAKSERSLRFLHLLKVARLGRSHTSKFSTTTLPILYIDILYQSLDNQCGCCNVSHSCKWIPSLLLSCYAHTWISLKSSILSRYLGMPYGHILSVAFVSRPLHGLLVLEH